MMPEAVDLAVASVVLPLLVVALAPFVTRQRRFLSSSAFVVTAFSGLLAVAAGFRAVSAGLIQKTVLSMGLPDLPFHLRLDPLAGFFLLVTGLLVFFVSVYSIGYVKGLLDRRSVTSLVVFYCLFLAGMYMVILSDDALIFLISWEVMAASSYFL
jgi:hydrogenase-4 component B